MPRAMLSPDQPNTALDKSAVQLSGVSDVDAKPARVLGMSEVDIFIDDPDQKAARVLGLSDKDISRGSRKIED